MTRKVEPLARNNISTQLTAIDNSSWSILQVSLAKPSRMSASSQDLRQLWDAASAHPFAPSVSKDSQFIIAFILILTGKMLPLVRSLLSNNSLAFFLSGIFALSKLHASRILFHYVNKALRSINNNSSNSGNTGFARIWVSHVNQHVSTSATDNLLIDLELFT
jgi:hypothetical protein